MRGSFNTRLLALVMALCALTLVAAGCGDDGDSGGDAEAEVTELVEESVAFEDPATICEENFTEAALEENYEGKDREARVEDCTENDPGGVTDIEVSEVKVEGETGTAKVVARAEGDEETSDFIVEVRDEDGWKVDGVEAIVP